MASKLFTRRSKKAGLPPGTLLSADSPGERASITIMDYDEGHFAEKTVETAEECAKFRNTQTVTWIDVNGVKDAGVVEALGKDFGIHPLVLEDIMTPGQRPKMEDFGDYVYIVLNMLSVKAGGGDTSTEQVSLLIGRHWVISFQEQNGSDVFGQLRERIRTAKGVIRKMGPDYLAYSLIDGIADNYFVALENQGEKIETLEEELVKEPGQHIIGTLHHYRSELIFLHKSVWPLREVIGGLERGDSKLFTEGTRIYLRDIYDHIVQLMDSVDTYRDMLTGLLDIYLSSINNKLNEIMKTLTIIATIFIPLTFVTGVFGMNFKLIPGLDSPWGFPAVLALMAVMGAIMLAYFRKKRWL